MPNASTARLAVFASGGGSNFEALVSAERNGQLGGHVALLLCDTPGAGVLTRAARLDVDAQCPPTGRFRSRLEDEAPWLAVLRAHAIDIVLLAGFMRRVHAPLLDAYADRMLNIHPSLLPAFPGLDAIGQAWRAGVRVTGCTVHLVGAELDAGAILGQRVVEIAEGDTRESLEARVHAAEHALYPATVRRFLTEPWSRDGARVVWGALRGAQS